jgi:hypothetical protein
VLKEVAIANAKAVVVFAAIEKDGLEKGALPSVARRMLELRQTVRGFLETCDLARGEAVLNVVKEKIRLHLVAEH